jgi:hypothetical protein
MALRKIIQVEGEAFINTQSGSISIGQQKSAFTAYCKITNLSGDKLNGRVTVECAGDNYKINKTFAVQFSVEDNAPNFIKQAYLQLKTLPEWADATDC